MTACLCEYARRQAKITLTPALSLLLAKTGACVGPPQGLLFDKFLIQPELIRHVVIPKQSLAWTRGRHCRHPGLHRRRTQRSHPANERD